MTWLDDFSAYTVSNLGERELDALSFRGVTESQAREFQIGYLNRNLSSIKYPSSFLDWSHRGSKLDDVFVFPLTNTLGTIKGFQFRHVERSRTGYMDFFSTKDEVSLFGLSQAISSIWETKRVLLVEGAFDLFPLQKFVPNTIATLTAHVSESLLRVLYRLVDEVWLGYDMDTAGRNACVSFSKNHGEDFNVKILSYPRVKLADGKVIKDPADLWEAWGDQKLEGFIQKSGVVTS